MLKVEVNKKGLGRGYPFPSRL